MLYISQSEEETRSIGAKLGSCLQDHSVVCFFGDLGAGKTTFIKGLVSSVSQLDEDAVNSPTFVYLNIYEGARTVYHFDLYRLKNSDEFIAMGFDEMFYAGTVCCLEWSERISDILPAKQIHVSIKHLSEGKREIKIEGIENL